MGTKIQTTGLIIRNMAVVGEGDRLVKALTRDEGVVRAFVRRAKNLKDSRSSATGMMCYSHLHLYKGRESYIIDAARPLESFFQIHFQMERQALGMYFCQLAEELAPEGAEAGEYLRLMLNALHFLCGAERPYQMLKPVVELRMLALSGYMPDLLGCAACGKYQDEQMLFRVDRGEIYCRDCYQNKGAPALALNVGALTAMRHIIYSDFEKIFFFSLSPDSLKALSDGAEAYMMSVLQKELRTLEFYKSVR